MKDSLDILCTNVKEEIPPSIENEPLVLKHDSLNILRTDYICHHGILGMKWGVRRFQPYGKDYHGNGKYVGGIRRKIRDIRDKKYREYDTSYSKVGSVSGTRSKYTNIDGSLNEKGRFHSQSYINKQLKKNEKYYDKVIKKYNKRAEQYGDDPEMQKKFLDLAKEAEQTKKSVDASIKRMDLDSVMRNETIDRENAMKAIKTAAGVTVGAAGGSLLVGGALGLSNAMKKDQDVRKAVTSFNIKEPVDSAIDIVKSTDIGEKGYEAMETALKTYFDAKAYVVAVGLNQANTRLQKAGVYDNFGQSIGGGLNTAATTSGYTPERIESITSNLAQLSNSPTANKFIEAGNDTITQALNNPNTVNALVNLNSANSPDIPTGSYANNRLMRR